MFVATEEALVTTFSHHWLNSKRHSFNFAWFLWGGAPTDFCLPLQCVLYVFQ